MEGDRVLDLAAGPGGAGLAAAHRVGTTGRVVLSDVAAEMVAVAAKRARADAHVRTAAFDQNAIDFGEASFDAVINRHGLMFVEDPAQTVAEAVRVLRAGGHYAVITWDRRELNPWLGLVLDAVGARFGVPFPPPNVRGPFSLDTPDKLMSVLRDGGLQNVTVQPMSTPMHAASLAEWWDRVPKLAGPLAIALAEWRPTSAMRSASARLSPARPLQAATRTESCSRARSSSAGATKRHADRQGAPLPRAGRSAAHQPEQ